MIRRMRLLICGLAVLGLFACADARIRDTKTTDPEAGSKSKPASSADQPATAQNSVAGSSPTQRIDSARAMQYLKEIVAFGRRAPGSPGQKKQQDYLRTKLKNDRLEEDVFTAETPAGKFELRNLIVKFSGTEDSVIVFASHYDTAFTVKNFVGANDGGSSTALLLELANHLRGRKLQGPSVWLVWFDGEEAFQSWSATDKLYGSRHLAAKWQQDGTAKKIKALLLADMIGDADLNIDRDTNSSPWLSDLLLRAATNLGVQSHFYARQTGIDDDHLPFVSIGVPSLDIIDLDYGYANVFWHTPEDTLDKVSAKSLQITGDVILETLRLLGSH